jgi:hypothetical protein
MFPAAIQPAIQRAYTLFDPSLLYLKPLQITSCKHLIQRTYPIPRRGSVKDPGRTPLCYNPMMVGTGTAYVCLVGWSRTFSVLRSTVLHVHSSLNIQPLGAWSFNEGFMYGAAPATQAHDLL